jgi:hypothetical protein
MGHDGGFSGDNWEFEIILRRLKSGGARSSPLVVFSRRRQCIEEANSPPHGQKTSG